MKKLRELWTALFRRYLAGKLLGVLAVIWLAFWYVSGPSSVDVGDIQVDLDRSLSLAGPDQDRNGIRDDVDRYIEALARKKGYSEQQVKAIRQEARSMQGLVTVDLRDKKAIHKAHDKDVNSVHCLFDRFGPDKADVISEEINKLTVNTKQRALAYLKYDHMLNGTVTTLPQGNTCEP